MGHREEEEPENVVFFQFAAPGPGKATAFCELQDCKNETPEEKKRRIENDRVVKKGAEKLAVKKGRYCSGSAAAGAVVAGGKVEEAGKA